MKQETRVAMHGPSLGAVNGVSTHLNQFFDPLIAEYVTLPHFQVGSAGRQVGPDRTIFRFIVSPFVFAVFLLRHHTDIFHLNTSLEPKCYWGDIAYLLVARLLGHKVSYQAPSGSLPEGFLAGNAFFISARTHATIAAFSAGVPALSVAYSIKAKGINRDLFGDTQLVLDSPSVWPDTLHAGFTRLREDETDIRALPAERPLWKQHAVVSVDTLASILGTH